MFDAIVALYESEKKAKQQQQEFAKSVEASAGANELDSILETTFSLVSCFSTNAFSSVGWCVDNRASRHMTFDKKDFSRLQEQVDAIQGELGMMPLAISISFLMPLGDVLHIDDVLYVPSLMKSSFVSSTIDLQCMADFAS